MQNEPLLSVFCIERGRTLAPRAGFATTPFDWRIDGRLYVQNPDGFVVELVFERLDEETVESLR